MEKQIRNNKKNTHMLRERERNRVGRVSREVGGRERREYIYIYIYIVCYLT